MTEYILGCLIGVSWVLLLVGFLSMRWLANFHNDACDYWYKAYMKERERSEELRDQIKRSEDSADWWKKGNRNGW